MNVSLLRDVRSALLGAGYLAPFSENVPLERQVSVVRTAFYRYRSVVTHRADYVQWVVNNWEEALARDLLKDPAYRKAR